MIVGRSTGRVALRQEYIDIKGKLSLVSPSPAFLNFLPNL